MRFDRWYIWFAEDLDASSAPPTRRRPLAPAKARRWLAPALLALGLVVSYVHAIVGFVVLFENLIAVMIAVGAFRVWQFSQSRDCDEWGRKLAVI